MARQSKILEAEKLSFKQHELILKWYWKYENVCEVQQWWREFVTEPPTQLTTSHIRDKSEANGTVHDVHKQRSGMPHTVQPLLTQHQKWICYGKKFKHHVPLSQRTPWPQLLVNQSPKLRSVYMLMVATKICSSSKFVTSIHFSVYKIWITNKLFNFEYVYIFLGSSVFYPKVSYPKKYAYFVSI
jgi:hypothetical protein